MEDTAYAIAEGAVMLQQALARIMTEYPVAKTREIAGHPLATFVRQDIPEILQRNLPQHSNLLWVASVGQGRWSDAPWIGVFDPLVTETPQE
jgi:5-methylcytosine-specific restriction protein A